MAYSGRFNVALSTFLFILFHINPQARGQYLAVCEMQKYKFLFSNCATQNYQCKTEKEALEAAKESLRVMSVLDASIRYVMVAKVLGGGYYSIIGRHEL